MAVCLALTSLDVTRDDQTLPKMTENKIPGFLAPRAAQVGCTLSKNKFELNLKAYLADGFSLKLRP